MNKSYYLSQDRLFHHWHL